MSCCFETRSVKEEKYTKYVAESMTSERKSLFKKNSWTDRYTNTVTKKRWRVEKKCYLLINN